MGLSTCSHFLKVGVSRTLNDLFFKSVLGCSCLYLQVAFKEKVWNLLGLVKSTVPQHFSHNFAFHSSSLYVCSVEELVFMLLNVPWEYKGTILVLPIYFKCFRLL